MVLVQSSDETPIHYRVVGSGPRALMLVHGWMVSGAVWDDFLAELEATQFRVIIPDQRGTGASESSGSFSLDQYAADLRAIADKEKLATYSVVGHSMGGQIAQCVAATDSRVASLVLLNPVPASGLPLPEEAAELFRNSGGDREKQRMIFSMACKELSPAALERLLDDAVQIPLACIRGAYDAWTAGGFVQTLAAIACPTLVLATDDPFLPRELLEQTVVSLIRGARLAHLPGPGHYPQVERPADTAALVTSFLQANAR